MDANHAHDLGHILGDDDEAPTWDLAQAFTRGMTGEQAMAFRHGYDDAQRDRS